MSRPVSVHSPAGRGDADQSLEVTGELALVREPGLRRPSARAESVLPVAVSAAVSPTGFGSAVRAAVRHPAGDGTGASAVRPGPLARSGPIVIATSERPSVAPLRTPGGASGSLGRGRLQGRARLQLVDGVAVPPGRF